MSDIAADYELQADRLRRLLKAKKTFEPAMELALDLHAVTHTGVVSGSSSPTFCDHVLEGLAEGDYSVMLTEKDETIAWHFFHKKQKNVDSGDPKRKSLFPHLYHTIKISFFQDL